MKLETAEIIEKRQITADLWDIKLRAPQIAREARPGQFLHVRVADGVDPLLRRPMSIYRIGQDTIDLLVRPAGRGSRMMVEKGVGEPLDCMGPMGNGFTIHPSSRNLLMVGGGSGIGPMVALADHAVAKGLSVVVLFGFRSADRVFPSDLLPAEVEYGIATDDGSAGHDGLVTELVGDYLGWADQVYACGPRPMYLSLLDITRRTGIRKSVQVSLEENMACGVGACFGCVVETRGGEMKSVCEDGPVFEMRDLVWR
ncbi:MAG: dihydroorotate dehydrogenase electron transfer subunit [Chloroflexota bacterium]